MISSTEDPDIPSVSNSGKNRVKDVVLCRHNQREDPSGMEPVISIIIPHYNSVQSALNLLDSIPNDERIEVIVVDDRSSENITKLREKIGITNRSIYNNDKLNKGAGTARNIGLSHAKGKWLLFADSDDWFVEGWFDIVCKYLDSDFDMIYFPPTSYNTRTGKIGARHRHYEELIKQHHDKGTERTETELKYGFYTPWSKLIRRSVFEENGIWFDEQNVANDVMAMTKSALYSHKIFADSETIYCVTCGDNSLTTKKNEIKFDTIVDTKIRRYKFLKENLPERLFHYTHVDYYMAGSLADAILGKWGWKKVKEILNKYRKNQIQFLTIYMFEPSFLLRYIFLDLRWRIEMNG